jgi:hypothetical protein
VSDPTVVQPFKRNRGFWQFGRDALGPEAAQFAYHRVSCQAVAKILGDLGGCFARNVHIDEARDSTLIPVKAAFSFGHCMDPVM